MARAYFGVGDRDQGFEQLEKTYRERHGILVYVNVEPVFDDVRDDPRVVADQDVGRNLGASPAHPRQQRLIGLGLFDRRRGIKGHVDHRDGSNLREISPGSLRAVSL